MFVHQQGPAAAGAPGAFNIHQAQFGSPPMPPDPLHVSPISPILLQEQQSAFPSGPHFNERGSIAAMSTPSMPTYTDSRRATATSISGDNQMRQGIISGNLEWEYEDTGDSDELMGDSDEEIDTIKPQEANVGTIMATNMEGPLEGFGTRLRAFSTYVDDSTLTTYIPSAQSSPLNDTKTAAVFWHFVNVTGPSMSLYERHALDHSRFDQDGSVQKAGHNIWTCTS
jgi:hypothetical protein